MQGNNKYFVSETRTKRFEEVFLCLTFTKYDFVLKFTSWKIPKFVFFIPFALHSFLFDDSTAATMSTCGSVEARVRARAFVMYTECASSTTTANVLVSFDPIPIFFFVRMLHFGLCTVASAYKPYIAHRIEFGSHTRPYLSDAHSGNLPIE